MSRIRGFGWFILMTVPLVFFGCKAKRGMIGTRTPQNPDTEIIRSVLELQNPGANWEIRANVKIEMDDEKYSGLATLRIKGDEAMWISFRSGIGIELFRAYANLDTIWVKSRLLRIEEKEAWSSAGELIGIPADFFALKAMVTRQLIRSDQQASDDNPDFWQIRNSDGKWMERISSDDDNSKKYHARYRIEVPGPIITGMIIDDLNHMWTVQINYEGSQPGSVEKMTLQVIDHNQNVNVDIQYLSIERKDVVDLPFDRF